MVRYYFLPYKKLDLFFSLFTEQGYTVLAPQVEDGAIVYREMESSQSLPWGVTDQQKPGYYQLNAAQNENLAHKRAFDFTLPEQTVKSLFFKPKEILWKVARDESGKLAFQPTYQTRKQVIFGIRPCDLRAIEIQDRIFMQDTYHDAHYKEHREQSFLIAMNCTQSHDNCFCLSMGGSPKAKAGYDLAMTEINGGFVVEAGNENSKNYLSALTLETADNLQIHQAQNRMDNAVNTQSKTIPPLAQVEKTLHSSYHHPQWQDVAKRCLSCGNCTQACPTCFCHNERDVPELEGQTSQHVREWDSCFSLGHSYTHGGIFREDVSSRYRQWLTHKFSTWRDQFDIEGCVGCGRCITWCPVKIDVTDEINVIVKQDGSE